MSRSLIQTVSAGPQTVAELGTISLGTTTRRFGCNLALSGDAIECSGPGYYTVTASLVVAPTAAGVISVELYKNGAPVTGAISTTTVAAANDPASLSIVGTVRLGCCETGTLTLVLTEGAGSVENVAVRVEKA